MGKRRGRKGFTLAEVLVAVVIVAVTLAVAVPAAIGGVRRMDLKRLDESARSIFLAAQNSLTAMVGNGELKDFAKDTAGNEIAGKVADKIPGRVPKDFPKKDDGSGDNDLNYGNPEDLRYLDSENDAHKDALKKLLPGGSIDKELAGHRYVVEYNCETGAVYAVWYSDEKEFEGDSDSGITPYSYDKFAGEERDFNTRLKAGDGYGGILIGYYGGHGVKYALIGQMPVPSLTLTNAEELRLRIKMPDGTGFHDGDIGLEIKVTGKTSGVSKTILGGNRSAGAAVLLNQNQIGDLMLDTLNPSYTMDGLTTGTGWKYGKKFHEWAADSSVPTTPAGENLIPGEDITITVTTYYTDTDKTYLPRSVTVSCNSLFESVENVETGGVKIPTAMIAYGRHLQNLDAYTATGNADGIIGGAANIITAAKQVKPIDFETKAGSAEDNIYFWASTYQDSSSNAEKFTSIYNEHLTAYNGQSLPIRSLNAKENTDATVSNAAGLFAQVGTTAGSPTKLEKITLVNPAAEATQNVGALAGIAANVDITNCQVYLENDTQSYAPTDPSTPKITLSGSAGDLSAGGLAGTARGTVTITGSFAAAVVKGENSSIGGLVGKVQDSATFTIKESYAACYLADDSTSSHVGGLVGDASVGTVTIENSYAAGIIESADVAGGLLAESTESTEIKDSYAAVRYDNGTVSPRTVYGVAPKAKNTSTHVYFVRQADMTQNAIISTGMSTDELSKITNSSLGGTWYKLSDASGVEIENPSYAAFPYHQTIGTGSLSSPYPYPMLSSMGSSSNPMFHYGDWLESDTVIGPTMCYYDIVDGKPGYYAIMSGTTINTLATTGAATTDGYAVLSEYSLGINLGFTLNDDSLKYDLEAGSKTTVGAKEYFLYTLPASAWNAAVGAAQTEAKKQDGKYYQKIELDSGEVFLFNPLFACEAVNLGSDPSVVDQTTVREKPGLFSKMIDSSSAIGTTEPVQEGIVLRTARHLAKAADLSAVDDTASVPKGKTNPWRTKAYHQLLDIDYSKYEKINNDNTLTISVPGMSETNLQTPLLLGDRAKETSGSGVAGQYYGNRHEICKVYIGNNDNARETSSEGKDNFRKVSGLFGLVTNDSTVDGVRLVNAKVTANANTQYVGAVAGKVAGRNTKFTDCGVYVGNGREYNTYVVKATIKSASVGGFVGEFEGIVNDCFAAVKVKAEGESSNAGGFAGTFKDATVKDCYSGGHTENGVYTSGNESVNVWVSGATSNVGGFAGKVTNDKTLTLQGVCYTTCSVRNDKDTQEKDDPKEYTRTGRFVGLRPDGDEITLASGAIVYSTGVAFKNTDVVDPRSETTYLDLLIPEVGQRIGYELITKPYDSRMASTAAYPYITNLEAHYGDWPTKLNLVYYEKYKEEPGPGAVKVGDIWYGFYGQWNGTAGKREEINTLAKSGSAVDCGYALLSDHDLGDSFSWGSETYGSKTGRVMTYGKAEINKDGCVKLEKSGVSNLPTEYVYTLPFEALNQAPLDTYYRIISINGATTVCNPHFACEALNISNGEEKTIKLDVERSYTYRTFNMDKIQSKPGLTDGEDYENCVIIRTPQHLASAARYTRQKNNLSSRLSSRGWKYHQLLDLDYNEYEGGIYDGNSGVRRANGTGTNNDEKDRTGNKAGKSDAYPHLAVTLGQKANSSSSDDLDKVDVTTGSYNGHNHTIENLYVGISQESYVKEGTSDDLYAGVFGWVYGSTIKDINLQNITVNVATKSDGYDEDIRGTVLAIGGLAGRCSNSTVSGVTLEDVKIKVGDKGANKAENVGGLFGSIEGSSTIKECGIRVSSTKYGSHVVDNSDNNKSTYIGGFAGSITDATVENCYAAVKVRGYRYAGGFAGQLDGATLTDCYAGGHTENGAYKSGSDNANVYVHRSSSDVAAGGFAGLVGSNGATFNGVNYSTCSVGCNNSSAKCGRFVGEGTNYVKNGTASGDILYGFAPVFRNNNSVDPVEESYLEDQLDAWNISGAKTNANPYDSHWDGVAYPYKVATGQTEHYGDWMDLAEPSLVYYEKYDVPGASRIEVGSDYYGFGGSWKHADGSVDADEKIVGLSNSAAESIKEDGYALLWPVDKNYPYTQNFPETLECTIGSNEVTFRRTAGNGGGTDIFYKDAIQLQSAYYYLYLPDQSAGSIDLNSLFKYIGSDYYQTLTYSAEITRDSASVTRKGERWFNPHFALEAYNTKPANLNQPVEKQQNMLGLSGSTKESAVIVRTARQFGNLADYAVSGNASAKWHYHQTMDIDFGSTTAFTAAPVPFLDAGGSYNGHSHSLKNLKVNVNGGTALNVGVFGQVAGATVQNVQLENSEIAATGSSASGANVGGLVGLATGSATLGGNTGVNVRVKADVTSGDARVGGLFGRLQGESSGSQVKVTDCGVYINTKLAPDDHKSIDGLNGAYDYYSINAGDSASDYTGGLAGDVDQATLEKCYAAVKVTGNKYTGGLAGQLNGCTVKDCYAGGHTKDGEYVEPTDPNTPEVNVTGLGAGAHVGGFTGQTTGNVTFNGVCYTTCSVFAPNTEKDTVTGTTEYLGLFSGGASSGTVGCTESTLYATGKAWAKDSAASSVFGKATPRTEDEYSLALLTERKQLLNVILETGNSGSVPYDSALLDEGNPVPYLYKTTFTVHHGDWGLPDTRPVESTGILYFEIDKDGNLTYQIVGVTSDGNSLNDGNAKNFGFMDTVTDLDTLCTNRHVTADGTISEDDHIVTSGYVLFNGDEFRLTSPDTAGLTGTKDPDIVSKVLGILKANNEDELDVLEVFVTPSTDVTGKTVNNIFSRRGYESTKKQLYYTDGFAGVSDEAYGEGNPIAIRTVRQLDNIGATTLYFKQTHDLYGKNKTYTGAEGLQGGYDGDHYYILDLSMSSANDVGLFNTINSHTTLQNIILYSPDGKATISSTSELTGSPTGSAIWGAGGLVGGVKNGNLTDIVTITNCVVAGYKIQGNFTIGGLVGYAYYTVHIENCAAVNDLSCEKGTTNVSIGGLLGGYHSDSVKASEITNSYAGGTVTLKGNSSNISGIVGRDYGNSTSKKISIVKDCYSYLDYTDVGEGSSTTNANTVYAIGWNLNAGSSGNAYLQTSLPKDKDSLKVIETDQGTPNLPGNTSAAATRSYVPAGQYGGEKLSSDGLNPMENTSTSVRYPYKAVVQGAPDASGNLKYIHYGEWPTASTTSGSGSPAPGVTDGPEIFDGCVCTTLCTEDAVNRDCPVCARNISGCQPITVTDNEPGDNNPSGEVSGGDAAGDDMSGGDAPSESDPTTGDGEGTTSPVALPPDSPREVRELETSESGSDTPQEGGDA